MSHTTESWFNGFSNVWRCMYFEGRYEVCVCRCLAEVLCIQIKQQRVIEVCRAVFPSVNLHRSTFIFVVAIGSWQGIIWAWMSGFLPFVTGRVCVSKGSEKEWRHWGIDLRAYKNETRHRGGVAVVRRHICKELRQEIRQKLSRRVLTTAKVLRDSVRSVESYVQVPDHSIGDLCGTEWPLDRGFLRVFHSPPASIMSPMLHTDLSSVTHDIQSL
jgi:hypothetical protein